MGRRGISPGDDPKWVFNRLAPHYRDRPGYPAALLERLVDLAGGRGGRVAELGAGTGLVALPLASAGLQVTAVEPARRMLVALRDRAEVEGLSIERVHAAAEDTGLRAGDYDLVVLADAAQWVDPERAGGEIARLLRAGGALAVVEARFGETAFMRAITGLVASYNPKARIASNGVRDALFRAAMPRAPIKVEAFDHQEPVTAARVDEILRSLSFVGPALGPRRRDELLARARQIVSATRAPAWARRIELHWARKENGSKPLSQE
jgi:SAM-dependent methyltransferase